MRDFLHHLFVPRESNNQRAKLLHNESIFFVIVFLLLFQFALPKIEERFSNILGTTTDISAIKLLEVTNGDRQADGEESLVLNTTLSQAAEYKAQDMFAKNYWAHNAPDGATPWVFMKRAGYNYVYAGENLARGFTKSEDVVVAWMNSPSHRENMLSPNYKEVGFAVEDGKLLGENTTLVVEMFGNTTTAVVSKEKPEAGEPAPAHIQKTLNEPLVASSKVIPLIDSFGFSHNLSLTLLSFFIFVLMLDMLIIERRKIVRFLGHNLDHVLYFSAILIFVVIFGRGIIL